MVRLATPLFARIGIKVVGPDMVSQVHQIVFVFHGRDQIDIIK